MRTIAMFGASAIMVSLGLLFGHFAATQGDVGYAVGAGVSGISALGFIAAGLRAQ
jgi:hypothetical protein